MSPTIKTEEKLELINLKDQDLIDFTRTQNSLAWKGVLSSKDYVLRELVLGKSRIANDGDNELKVFMLKDLNTDQPLCSIELLIRESLKFHYNETTQKSEIKKVLSGTVGGVFTYPEHRGKGYARVMVDKLVDIARKEYLGNDGFIFLYSEIGEYYAKNGFKSFGIDLVKIDINDNLNLDDVPDISYDIIPYHDFENLIQQYRSKFLSEIEHKISKDHKTRISINPTSHLIDWFHLRSKFITYKLFESKQESQQDFFDFQNESYDSIRENFEKSQPKIFGLKTFNSSNEVDGFIVWTIDWAEDKSENFATILKIVSFDNEPQTTINLINLALNHLHKTPIMNKPTTKLTIWESEISEQTKKFLVKQYNAKTGIDNSSRSAILMCDSSEDVKLRNGDLIWEENTKLPWF
ncbi:hypothetical protein KGF54_001531 [Candida jiufengensis]|uniref:uncharacterized protein n=1 Tax=Candida jiufengensis TaxID=497108 RepID=UPI0022248AA1|nr:uncharacterized protein KGF54_001531 [Candida jiufengensis]KAI5954970.1 hypothetical protein KGF54_001531 [Candida jiufengensis]